jgi:hypothetical protein
VTLPQLLHLTNGAEVQGKVRSPDGRLARLLKAAEGRTTKATDEGLPRDRLAADRGGAA